jgi:hypothetical protein
VGLLRRLDELDRRLGLGPRGEDGEHAPRWRLVLPVAALVYIVAGIVLLLVGRAEWIIGLNLAATFAFVVGGAAVLFSRFRRRNSS